MAPPADQWRLGGIVPREVVPRNTDREAFAKVPGVLALQGAGVVLRMARDKDLPVEGGTE